jgi:hypothetical protein
MASTKVVEAPGQMVPPWGQMAMYEAFVRSARVYIAWLVYTGQVGWV